MKGQPVPRTEAVKQLESSDGPDDTWPEARKDIYLHLKDSISLYILAERFEDAAAADTIIDDIVDLNSYGEGPMRSHMYDRMSIVSCYKTSASLLIWTSVVTCSVHYLQLSTLDLFHCLFCLPDALLDSRVL